MKAIRILTTIALVLGGVFVVLAALSLVAVLVAVIVGGNADLQAQRDTAGMAKLVAVVGLAVTGPLFTFGLVFLVPGVIAHVVLRRMARNSPVGAFPVVIKGSSLATEDRRQGAG